MEHLNLWFGLVYRDANVYARQFINWCTYTKPLLCFYLRFYYKMTIKCNQQCFFFFCMSWYVIFFMKNFSLNYMKISTHCSFLCELLREYISDTLFAFRNGFSGLVVMAVVAVDGWCFVYT